MNSSQSEVVAMNCMESLFHSIPLILSNRND